MSRDPRHRFASLWRAIRRRLVIGLAIVAAAAAGLSTFWWLAPAEAPPRNVVTHEAPRSIPTIAFEDDQGRARSLAEFRGRVVLLNIWATWCVPCRREMPSLDRLQAALGGDDFEVVALSIDRAGIDAVRKFYADIALSNLAIYIDATGKAHRDLAVVGVPTTLLVDREGREIGRMAGPAEWGAPDIVDFLRRIIGPKDAMSTPRYTS
jgi:thiol-disulfide isomerase/thioredoxin